MPCNRLSIGPAVREANKAGIPVFTVDAQCAAEGVEIVSHGYRQLSGGALAGEAMIEILGKTGGKVLILDHKTANSCLREYRDSKKSLMLIMQQISRKDEMVSELPSGQSTDSYKATDPSGS